MKTRYCYTVHTALADITTNNRQEANRLARKLETATGQRPPIETKVKRQPKAQPTA